MRHLKIPALKIPTDSFKLTLKHTNNWTWVSALFTRTPLQYFTSAMSLLHTLGGFFHPLLSLHPLLHAPSHHYNNCPLVFLALSSIMSVRCTSIFFAQFALLFGFLGNRFLRNSILQLESWFCNDALFVATTLFTSVGLTLAILAVLWFHFVGD